MQNCFSALCRVRCKMYIQCTSMIQDIRYVLLHILEWAKDTPIFLFSSHLDVNRNWSEIMVAPHSAENLTSPPRSKKDRIVQLWERWIFISCAKIEVHLSQVCHLSLFWNSTIARNGKSFTFAASETPDWLASFPEPAQGIMFTTT